MNNSQLSRTKLLNVVFTVVYKYHYNNSAFVSPIYTFSLAGNVIVYTTIQGTNREKYFDDNNYKSENAHAGGK